jgi:hypothetical protein
VTGYRVRHGILQTPVVRFEHPKSGRRVTVIATVQIAPPAYYEQLRTMIGEMESAGAAVCYEGPGPVTKQERAVASDEERAAWDGEQRTRSEYLKAAGRYLGWVTQDAATLGRSTPSHDVDMPAMEYVRRAGPNNLLSRQQYIAESTTGLTQDQQEALLGGLRALGPRLQQFAWFHHLTLLVARWVGGAAGAEYALAEERNRRVLASLPADSDAVLPWGADHLPGLAAGLRKAGYRWRDTTWVTVGRLPAIWPSVKATWSGMRAARWTPSTPHDDAPPPPRPDGTASPGGSGPSVATDRADQPPHTSADG